LTSTYNINGQLVIWGGQTDERCSNSFQQTHCKEKNQIIIIKIVTKNNKNTTEEDLGGRVSRDKSVNTSVTTRMQKKENNNNNNSNG
jgi:hypothetical protein